MSDSQRKSFIALEAWLREAGEDLKAARMDNARWSEWIRTLAPSEYRKRIDREFAERMAREKAAVKLEEPVGSTPEADAAEHE